MKKRIFTVILAGLLLAGLLPFTAFAAPEAPISIRLQPDAGEAEQAAAAVLQDYLEEITGSRPVLTAPDAAGQGQTLVLRLKQDAEKPKGSYLLRAGFDETHTETAGDAAFYIDAADARGVWNGVYGFLRRLCGIEIYAADVKTVPQEGHFAFWLISVSVPHCGQRPVLRSFSRTVNSPDGRTSSHSYTMYFRAVLLPRRSSPVLSSSV